MKTPVSRLMTLIAIATALAGCERDSLSTPAPESVVAPVLSAPDKPSSDRAVAERIHVSDTDQITAMADPFCQPVFGQLDEERAIASGSAMNTDAKSLLAYVDRLSDCRRGRGVAIQNALLQSLGPITWDPTHDQPQISAVPGESFALLHGNASGKGSARRGDPLAVAGLGSARTLALTSNPMRTDYRGGGFDPNLSIFMTRALDWLSGGASAGPFNVVIAQMEQGYYFPDQVATRAWLDGEYGEAVSYNAAGACDGDALSGCLDGADLLILSNAGDLDATAVAQAMDRGIGVLFMHVNGGRTPASDALYPLLGITYHGDNYWGHPTLDMYSAPVGGERVDPEGDALLALLSGIERDSLDVDFADCENRSCPEGHAYTETIAPVLSSLRARLTANDTALLPLFDREGQDYDKAAVLIADLYKASIDFPIDAKTADANAVLRAQLADHAQAFLRKDAPAYADLGNHGRTTTDVARGTHVATLTARSHYRSAGYYARPGETVQITQVDNPDVKTKVRVNLIREGATHIFDGGGYTRPAATSSPDMPLEHGRTLSFTSPHGGPILIRFDDPSQAGKIVSFKFRNVAQHPVWRSPADDAAFIAAVDAGEHDWAEIITDGFEVHARMDKMQETLARGVSPSDIARLTAHNFTDLSHALAGFTGTGITPIADIHGWATAVGLPLQAIDVVKHMNADQALCGYGCSGNPYDAYWAFDPLGHGDLHELGHGLEKTRMRFDGQEGHTVTNPYSYYAKYRFMTETGGTTSCQNLPFQTLFDRAQAAARTPDPQAAMAAHDHDSWSYGAAINQQTMMGAQALGLLDDGRHLLGRLHVIERAFNAADDNDADWAGMADALGFGGYSRADARALSRNDWLLIATSHALGRDMSDWFRTWGHGFTDAALTHVAPLPDFPVRYFPVNPTGACEAFPADSLPLDGVSEWPVALAQKPRAVPSQILVEPHSADRCEHDGAR